MYLIGHLHNLRHFTITTRIPQGFVSLFKLGLLLLKHHWEYQILKNIKERDEMNSGLRWTSYRANGLFAKCWHSSVGRKMAK